MNISNSTIIDLNIRKEYLLLQIGSTWLLDSLHLYLVSFFSFIGFFLNVLSFWTFYKIKFQKQILKPYLKAYTLNSAICSLLILFNFTARSPRYIENITFSFIGGFFRCKSTQIVAAFYFFGNVLDCLILLERLSNFVRRLEKFSTFNPYHVITIAFFACLFVSMPFFYDYGIRIKDEFYDAINNLDIENNEQFTFCRRMPFFRKLLGMIIFGFVTLIRDFITLVLELVLSISSIILFKEYLNKKKKFFYLNLRNSNTSSRNNNVCLNNNAANSINSNLDELNTQLENFDNLFNKAEKFNLSLTKMTIYLSFCSIILHVIAGIVTLFLILNDNSLTAHFFLLIIICAYHIKFISNFIFFFQFNKNFKHFLIYRLLSCIKIR
jgi:hypothetical protein